MAILRVLSLPEKEEMRYKWSVNRLLLSLSVCLFFSLDLLTVSNC